MNPEGFLAVEQLVAHRAYKLTYMVFNCSINIVIFKYILDSGPVSVYTGLTQIVDNNINNIIHDIIFLGIHTLANYSFVCVKNLQKSEFLSFPKTDARNFLS